MGQKVNPISMRLGINRTWDSRWYAGSDYAEKLVEDLKLRKYIMKELKPAGISRVIIERAAQNTTVTIYAGRPGMIIGKKGADIESLKRKMSEVVSGNVSLNIVEVRKPEIDAKLVAEGIAQQLERRIAFRRAMKRGVQSALRFGAQGIRINVSGRLGGADIARMEWYREGRVPLHTLRADLDYGTAEALTTYGIIGIKVWIYKGDIMEHDPSARERRLSEQTGSSSGNRDNNRDNRDNKGREKR
jgi:small subunit ribosomal protein S3